MLSPTSGPEVTTQGSRGVLLQNLKSEGREPIRGRGCGNWMRTNREPSGRLQ
jgi:hypothetical protein